MIVVLTDDEVELLFRQDPRTKKDGGFQNFLIKLQKRFDNNTMTLELSDHDIERIQRYAFDYGNGGWETRLLGIFGRVLGTRLGQ